tara:strand:- start:1261 stop:2913 length:1653 start_codon:yes stop_codon:yes gene_type:complete
MSYQVLSRKWRPQVFEDVIGQTHITKTLQNSIAKNRIAHGFLFCGHRGIGKTSTARIFSKALNCLKLKKNNPCNQCSNCIDITSGRSLDVLEIDGASNRGIDEIRELREAVKYPPTNGNYRIYIIDEVHMLTNHAFNALLKTLEEPPKHVKFILATTDPQKLPQTILSRTLRFEFRRIRLNTLKDFLIKILNNESVVYDDASVIQIVKKGDGSVRDSLSVLDQAIAYTNSELRFDRVQEILGVISESLYQDILENILKRDKNLINNVHNSFNSGISITDFIVGFNHYLTQAMLVKTGTNIDVELEPKSIKWLNEQDDLKVLDILRMLQITQNFEKNLKNMFYPRLNLDSMLVKLLSLESTVTLTEVIEGKINKIPKDPFLNKQNELSYLKNLDKELDVKNNNKISNNYEIGKNIEIKNQNNTLIEDKVVHKSKLDLNFFTRNWNDFLEQIENEHPKYLTYLSDVRLSYFRLGVLGIEIDSKSDFSANGIRNNQEKLEKIFSEYVGEVINIELEVKNEISEDKSEKQIKDAKGHPLFEKIVDTFDGEIIRS